MRAAVNGDAWIDRHRSDSTTGGDDRHGHIVSTYVTSNHHEYGLAGPRPDATRTAPQLGHQSHVDGSAGVRIIHQRHVLHRNAQACAKLDQFANAITLNRVAVKNDEFRLAL